ncbi:tyrosine-protein kinase-like otk [Drosophila montana]|uniref:tyrosine-protein kinase-like otk n=1 Tax=Drosophila montana TaxID=40370 RepID=UPI00313DE0D8
MDMNMLLTLNLAFAVLAPSLASSSRFIQPPQSQSIIENDAVDFGCEATGPSSDLHYEWLHNGQQIVYDRRVARIDSNLHIESVQREDAGDYVCIAASVASGARQASPPAKLSVICKYPNPFMTMTIMAESMPKTCAKKYLTTF